jgi:hypothetical protein
MVAVEHLIIERLHNQREVVAEQEVGREQIEQIALKPNELLQQLKLHSSGVPTRSSTALGG